jgi:hypothetical protein
MLLGRRTTNDQQQEFAAYAAIGRYQRVEARKQANGPGIGLNGPQPHDQQTSAYQVLLTHL